jgi:MFS family permease
MSSADTAPPAAVAPYDLRHGFACACASLLVGLSQGLGLQLVSTNLPAVQGSLGASAAEAAWLTTAYFAAAIPAVLLLTKFRLHFGLRRFANLGVGLFLAVGVLHLLTRDIDTAIAARAALGFAAAPLSTLAVLYMVEAFPKKLAGAGLVLGFAAAQVAAPLSRLVSEDLLQIGQWHGLFLIDVALAVLSLAAVNAVRLAPTPRQSAFTPGDAVVFPLFALGIGLLCAVAAHGRLRWWTDTPWVGAALAAAIGCLGLYAIIELHRSRPMLDLRWLTQPFMLRFVAAVLMFRIVLSEQTVGAVGMMNLLGLNNEQMHGLFLLVLAGIVAGFFVALAAATKLHANVIAMLAAGVIAAAAWLDADATVLTRPAELYLTQTLLAGGLALFFAASVIAGFGRVLAEGADKLVSFLTAFAMSQYLGTLLGSAWLGTYLADQQKKHYAALVEHLVASDPQISERISQFAGLLAGVLADRGALALQGAAQFAQQVALQSFVLAYNDLFRQVAVCAAGILLWLLYITIRRRSWVPLASA